MIRAPIGNKEYWDGRVKKFSQATEYGRSLLREAEKNPAYAPQFWLDQSKNIFRIIMLRYSRGDSVGDLREYFPEILDAWEISNARSEQVCSEQGIDSCRDWIFELSNLNHYNWCFWLIGLALVFEVPEDQWCRLMQLIRGEGEDRLIDLVVAKRSSNRKIGVDLLHSKPYARLLKAIEAPPLSQGALLRAFVDHWYPELARKGKAELWWYVFGNPEKNPLEMGSYFGRWCIEAAGAVKAFALDDSLCIGHEHYPGDLLHATDQNLNHGGESADDKSGWLKKLWRR